MPVRSPLALAEQSDKLFFYSNLTKLDIRIRVGSPNDTAQIHLEMDGTDITGPLTIPNTGDWQNWTDVVVRKVHLSAGVRVLRMVVDTHGLNLNYTEFIPGAE